MIDGWFHASRSPLGIVTWFGIALTLILSIIMFTQPILSHLTPFAVKINDSTYLIGSDCKSSDGRQVLYGSDCSYYNALRTMILMGFSIGLLTLTLLFFFLFSPTCIIHMSRLIVVWMMCITLICNLVGMSIFIGWKNKIASDRNPDPGFILLILIVVIQFFLLITLYYVVIGMNQSLQQSLQPSHESLPYTRMGENANAPMHVPPQYLPQYLPATVPAASTDSNSNSDVKTAPVPALVEAEPEFKFAVSG